MLRPYTWHTSDEIAFMQRLVDRRNFKALYNLQRIVDQRSWTGHGMNVDVAQIRQWLDFALGPDRSLTQCLGQNAIKN